MICKYCGYNMPKSAVFCDGCKASAADSRIAPPDTVISKSSGKQLFRIIATFAVIAVSFAAFTGVVVAGNMNNASNNRTAFKGESKSEYAVINEDNFDNKTADYEGSKFVPDSASVIEEQNDFEISVKSLSVEKGYYDGIVDLNNGGNDGFIIEIENNSDNYIESVDLYCIAYTDKDTAVILSDASCEEANSDFSKYFVQYSVDDVRCASDKTAKLGIRCDSKKFYGARFFVASYTTLQGKTVINENAAKWSNALAQSAVTEEQ